MSGLHRLIGLAANAGAAAFLIYALIDGRRGASFQTSELAMVTLFAAYICVNGFLVWRHVNTDSEIQELEKQLTKAELRKRIREAEAAR